MFVLFFFIIYILVHVQLSFLISHLCHRFLADVYSSFSFPLWLEEKLSEHVRELLERETKDGELMWLEEEGAIAADHVTSLSSSHTHLVPLPLEWLTPFTTP